MRPYQIAALEAIESEFENGAKSTQVVLATGLGKTVIAAERIRRTRQRGVRTLFLAHRTELLQQTQEKLAAAGVLSELEQGTSRASMGASVVVGSTQSMTAERRARFGAGFFGEIITDECHHAPARSYRAVFESWPEARMLGLTATPERADGKLVSSIFKTIAFRLDLREAIEQKWLTRILMQQVKLKSLDLRGIKRVAGDFQAAELEARMSDERVIHEVCAPMVELSECRPTIVFAVSVSHAHAIAAALRNRYGKRAVALDGSAKKDERKQVLRDFAEARFEYLVNCALFTEGFDSPRIACVAMARPTLSRTLYMQMIGRGTRLLGKTYEESIANGKSDCKALDFVGMTDRHSLINAADAIAGTAGVTDELRDEIEALMVSEKSRAMDVEDVYAKACASLATRIGDERFLAVAAYRAAEIDPFLGDFAKPLTRERFKAGGGPITQAMREALRKVLGMSKPPADLTMLEAQEWIRAAHARTRAGLATYKQCKALRSAKLRQDALKRMPMERANVLIGMLEKGDPARGIKPWHAAVLMFVPEREGNIR
jgi:superfamily II DNA or RNA helicase